MKFASSVEIVPIALNRIFSLNSSPLLLNIKYKVMPTKTNPIIAAMKPNEIRPEYTVSSDNRSGLKVISTGHNSFSHSPEGPQRGSQMLLAGQ